LPVAQYSFAHVEVQGPLDASQAQLWMIDPRAWAPDAWFWTQHPCVHWSLLDVLPSSCAQHA
jgi:hypothetical protein